MKGGNRPLGYTIVEVMIVLAISGVMFFIAATFISGKQARTEFTAGTNQFNIEMQDIISQVTAGQYSDVAFGCSPDLSTQTYPVISAVSNTNGSCVFVGKIMDLTSQTSKYTVYPMAALRQATNLKNTAPIRMSGGPVDLSSTQAIPQSLLVKDLKVDDANGNPVAPVTITGVGFAQSPGVADATHGGYITGGQSVGLYYTNTSLTSGVAISLLSAQSATICITDGSRFAEVQLGSNASSSNQLSANLQVVPTC